MADNQFLQAEDQYFLLKGQLVSGRITPDQFEAAVKQLMVQDEQGRYWMLGPDSGKWYVHNGQTWVEAQWRGAAQRPVEQPRSYYPPAPSIPATPAYSAGPSFPPVQARKNSMAPILAIGVIALLFLCGVAGLLLLTTQGIVKISLPGTNPTPTSLPTIPRPLPLPSPIVLLPSPIPQPTPAATIVPPTVVPPTPVPPAGASPTVSVTTTPALGTSELIAKADALTLQSKFEEAGPLYERAVQADPSNALANARWARMLDLQAYLEKRDDLWPLAASKAEAAAQLAPNSAEVLVQQARAYIGNLNYDKALAAAQKAVQIAPASGDARAALAEAFLNKASLGEAQTAAQQGFQLDANSAEVHRVLGYVLLAQGKTQAAVAEFEKAAQIEPNLAVRHAELGARYQETLEYAKAAASYQLAVSLYPRGAYAYYGLGRAFFDLKQNDKAIENTTRATELNKSYVEAYYFLGLIYYAIDDCTRAVPTFHKNLELDPKAHRAMAYLGWCQYKAGNPIVAADWAQRAAAIDPTFDETRKLQATLVVALATPTPLPPPGLYVTSMRLEPGAPGPKQDVSFYPTFLNTTNAVQNFNWKVFVYKTENMQKSFGESALTFTNFPVGSSEQQALGIWRTGFGSCFNYAVRVAWLDQNNAITFFSAPNGMVFEYPFSVC